MKANEEKGMSDWMGGEDLSEKSANNYEKEVRDNIYMVEGGRLAPEVAIKNILALLKPDEPQKCDCTEITKEGAGTDPNCVYHGVYGTEYEPQGRKCPDCFGTGRLDNGDGFNAVCNICNGSGQATKEDKGETAHQSVVRALNSCSKRADRYEKALEELARLGNEPHYGNSIGNKIAQQALKGDS